MTRYALGCDIGGTFTDFMLVDLDTGETVVDKCLTTPDDPTRAVMEGVARLAERRPGLAAGLDRVVHGTTLMINAIIERKGAATALVTTEGFRDIVEIGREKRYDVYDIWAQFPRPLAPRRWRREVAERVYSDGRVLRPLDEEGARRELRTLAADGVESIAVSLLHAYANPVHEQALEALAREVAPGLFVSLSSDVLPEIREYERTCTTLANAYVKPIAARYLATLIDELRRAGFRRRLYIMLSSGGVTSVDAAQRYPVRVVESGPAGGATAGEFLARGLGAADLLAFDMGGTTAKCCVITDGQAGKTSECEVARIHRFKKGSGIPLKIPMVDLVEIGAGGGSIAHVSSLGLLEVGPESAGAAPGPACYGGGGHAATVTDADLVLGYLNPDFFLGGEMRLDRDAAARAIGAVARPLDLDLLAAARGIHEVVTATMAASTKIHVAEKGRDMKTLTLLAFGGAGPVHAYGLARSLKFPRIVVPRAAGVMASLGFLVAPIAFDLVRTYKTTVPLASAEAIGSAFEALERDGLAILEAPAAQARYTRTLDMRYVGQGYEVSVAAPPTLDPAALRKAFNAVYQALYGRTYDDVEIEILNLRVVASLPPMPFTWRAPAPSGGAPVKGRRDAWCLDTGRMVPHTVYDRAALAAGFTAPGPAIVEERECTTIIGSQASLAVDEVGSLHVRLA